MSQPIVFKQRRSAPDGGRVHVEYHLLPATEEMRVIVKEPHHTHCAYFTCGHPGWMAEYESWVQSVINRPQTGDQE